MDNEKRWIVINGQRFEVEHSPAEKRVRERAQMSLLDYIDEIESKKETDENKMAENRNNIEGLKEMV